MSRSEQTLKRDYSSFVFIRQEAPNTRLSLSYNEDNEDNADKADNANNAETTSLDSKTLTVSRSSLQGLPGTDHLGGVTSA